MALFKPFLSLPLLVAQPERGDSLAPTSNLLPPCGAQRQSCPTLTARAKAFGRLLPPKPCRSFVPYARCCPVSSFSIRKARHRARHKHPSTHGEAPLSKPPRSPNSHPKWSEIPPTDGSEIRPHLMNRTRPNQITREEASQPSPDATPLQMVCFGPLNLSRGKCFWAGAPEPMKATPPSKDEDTNSRQMSCARSTHLSPCPNLLGESSLTLGTRAKMPLSPFQPRPPPGLSSTSLFAVKLLVCLPALSLSVKSFFFSLTRAPPTRRRSCELNDASLCIM